MGGEEIMPGREELVESSLPDYPAPERAVAALKAMCDYAEWRQRPPRRVVRFPVNRKRVERIIVRNLRIGRTKIGEVQAKDIMRAYNFNVPAGNLAATSEEAIDVAMRIGLPVAMKIVSPDIIHKSDLGGVRLDLESPAAVEDAFDLMMLRTRRAMPEARLDGVYIEQMFPPGHEVILGMTRDSKFGPMLMFGLGGIFVEVLKDVTFHLAPITSDEAMDMLQSTKAFSLLKGVRGKPPVDILSITSSLQRISQLVADFPQVSELDINPLIVGEIGTEAVVADARLALSKTEVKA
jgi:acetyltransferase